MKSKSIRKIELRWSRVSVVKDGDAEYSKTVSRSIETVEVINTLIGPEVHEVVIALHLDTQNKIIGYHEVSRGGVAGSAVTPADVYRPVLLSGASKIILAHNHPSGNPTPSTEDIAITKRIKEAGDILSVRLLDHIIVGAGYYSFLDSGIL